MIEYSKSDTDLFTGEKPPQRVRQRRADPKSRKLEKEQAEFPEGLDLPPPRNAIFSGVSEDQMKRIHSMLVNFCSLEDGTIVKNINLKQFARESGQQINNMIIQEVCAVQPMMEELDLSDCVEVSDVGLWSLARHCTRIKALTLSGCHQLTQIGLRSISLRCCEITTLNFNYCHLLDDIALTVIATGAWKLQTLLLRGCVGITDTGVSRVAKANDRLRVLDLNGCTNVGEFGDRALKEVGAFCGQLEYLDFSGCRCVEDAGIRFVAVGCQKLQALLISGCEYVTGKSLRSLAKHNKHLGELRLLGLRRLGDKDLEALHSCAFQRSLKHLELAGGKGAGLSQITDRGVGTLSSALGAQLVSLALQGNNLTDFATIIVSNLCSRLESLDLRNNAHITDNTIHSAARSISGLTTLKLDGNPAITMNALYSHIGSGEGSLEFVDLAQKWLGYQPKSNSSELMGARRLFRLQTASALLIQCGIRRKAAYKKWRERRRWWLMNVVIPRLQAYIRMRQRRKRYREVLHARFKIRCIVKIQARWRAYREVLVKQRKIKSIRFAQLKLECTVKMQKVFRGYMARLRVKAVRNVNANKLLQEAKIQSNHELASISITAFWRGSKARRLASERRVRREILRERRALEERMMRLIQRIAHGKLGRIIARTRRRELEFAHHRWCCARIVQKVYRGHVGRRRFQTFLAAWILRKRNTAATEVQRIFRGYRGKILAAVGRALRQFRARQQFSCREIQRWARGCVARAYVKRFVQAKERERKYKKSVLVMQRIYRGHKGREAAEIERQVMALEKKAKPLFDLLKNLEADGMKLGKLIKRMEGKDKMMTDDIFEIGRELDHAQNTTQKYTDSSRINGVPQRFLTKYLRVRLKDHYEHEQEAHKVKYTELQKKRVEMRHLEKSIEAARRELLPLTLGLISEVKRTRSIKLRARVRLEKEASTKIQALWRRALVRTAQRDPYMVSWIQSYDEFQGEKPYYYNTVSGETSWITPQAFKYFHAFKLRDDSKLLKKKDRKESDAFDD